MTETQTARRVIVPNAVIPRVWCTSGFCHVSAENVPRAEAAGWKCPKHRAMADTVKHEVTMFEGVPLKEHPAYRPAEIRPEVGDQAMWKDKIYVITSVGAVGVKIRLPRGKKEYTVKYDDGALLIDSMEPF